MQWLLTLAPPVHGESCCRQSCGNLKKKVYRVPVKIVTELVTTGLDRLQHCARNKAFHLGDWGTRIIIIEAYVVAPWLLWSSQSFDSSPPRLHVISPSAKRWRLRPSLSYCFRRFSLRTVGWVIVIVSNNISNKNSNSNNNNSNSNRNRNRNRSSYLCCKSLDHWQYQSLDSSRYALKPREYWRPLRV